MPDSTGFNHEPHFGTVYHRCSVCDEIPWGVILTGEQRERHAAIHERERRKRLETERKANLKLARKARAGH